MERKPYEAPSADEIVIEQTEILGASLIETNVESSGSDNLWDLFN